MPVDRLFHPRAGHSRKVTALTDFQFLTWWTYVLAADDYGVMRRSAVTLQAANDALARRQIKVVDRAFDAVVDIGLVVPFEHQRDGYVCQLDWQDFQRVRYPRDSHLPTPPPEILQKCSRSTRELFQKHSRKVSEILPESSGNSSEAFPVLPRAGGREMANANANGKRQIPTADGEISAETITDSYRMCWKAAYGFESSLLLKPLEYMQLEQQITAHGGAPLLEALRAFFAADDAYLRKAKHPLALFLRDPLKYLAKELTPMRDMEREQLAQADAALALLRKDRSA